MGVNRPATCRHQSAGSTVTDLDFDFTEVQRAFSKARVEDFVRFVGRRTEERPDFRDMQFRDAWYVLVAEYAALTRQEVAE
jgi:hypothetical protein